MPFILFLIGGQQLYNIVMISAIHQWQKPSAISILMSPPSKTSLPPLQVVTEHQLWFPMSYNKFPLAPMLHMALYMFQCYSLKSSHLLPLQLCPKICSLCLHLHCCPISVSSFEDYFLRERFYYFCEEDECTRCNYELELNLPSIFIPKRIRDHHSPPPPFIYILLGNGD